MRAPVRVLAATAAARRSTAYLHPRFTSTTAAAPAPEDDLSQISARNEPELTHDAVDEPRRTSFLYFANVYPLRLGWWDLRSYFAKVRVLASPRSCKWTSLTPIFLP